LTAGDHRYQEKDKEKEEEKDEEKDKDKDKDENPHTEKTIFSVMCMRPQAPSRTQNKFYFLRNERENDKCTLLRNRTRC